MIESRAGFPQPIFIGGVGRSGTHPMGRLLEADPRYHRIRTEIRFHAHPRGLPGLCAGRVAFVEFAARMTGAWYERGVNRRQGLQRLASPEEMAAALEELEAGLGDDPHAASARFVRRLLDPSAAAAGKPAWAELTGQVIEHAPFLLRLFPEARFVNMVRDGRAVVAGTLRKVDLTDDPMHALSKWGKMIAASDEGMRAVPAERTLTVHLDDFTAFDRERTFARLIEFLEIDDPGPMREYFDREISAERAHVGAWRERMAPADARRVDRRYRRMLRELRRGGISWTPRAR